MLTVSVSKSLTGSDLRISERGLIKGKPFGRYQKWKLNGFGFRGGEITPEPRAGITRVMVLGASEAFGLYEVDGGEFPSQLGAILEKKGAFEVVNAAVAGMSLKTCIRYWDEWAATFGPKIVVLYFNPLFYLRNVPPSLPSNGTQDEVVKARMFESRFVSRLKARISLPTWLRRLRRERELRRLRADKDQSWYFAILPKERLEMFGEDLAQMLEAVRRRSALPILVTQAMRAASLKDPEDQEELRAELVFRPRANEALLLEFSSEANKMIREMGKRQGVAVIDVAARLGGRHDCFEDLVHFSDVGANLIASLIADQVDAIVSGSTAVTAPSREKQGGAGGQE